MQNLQEQINQARRHPVTMSVVGVENTTVTIAYSEDDLQDFNGAGERSLRRQMFDRARVRFAKQGATNVRYGMLPIHGS